MKIQVTEKDIDLANKAKKNRHNLACYTCPIAQACTRQFCDDFVGVSRRGIFLDKKVLVLPQSAIDFILAYDKNKEVKPFVFEVIEK